ncbi:ubiquitin-associated and sh3 domain-containing [Lynx pardinus]|uniref:Ubiquitin-associated and sh3 domain-containing n=1 Tax=Lynx pardinus TaxID=191816 RepID=A0A485P636_LYNPA|nr:ubiquitin-associated and sh3 domain-containing [Lynx pardinus]
MAAREELYSKVTPRRSRQQRPGTIKHGSALDVLLSMGFPRARASRKGPSTELWVGGQRAQAAKAQVLFQPVLWSWVSHLTPQGLTGSLWGEQD